MPSSLTNAVATTVQNLIIPEVVLATNGGPMEKPLNIVYSTNPQLALAEDGAKYCVKGAEDIGIVLAEILGHVLASYVQIPVPDYAVGRFDEAGPPVFASALLENAMRDVEPWVKVNRVSDTGMLSRLIALDIWLANNDRNIGNLLGRPEATSTNGSIELVAIDFEKAATVRKTAPTFEIPTMPPKSFWPRGILGTYCRTRANIAQAELPRFRAITDGQIQNAVNGSFAAVRMDNAEKMDTVITILKKRRDNLKALLQEEWN
jgi:hypothetical protein